MELQTILALLVVAAAVLYVGRGAWRTLRSARAASADDGCGSSCGCDSSPSRRA